jgi:hypothetical protein
LHLRCLNTNLQRNNFNQISQVSYSCRGIKGKKLQEEDNVPYWNKNISETYCCTVKYYILAIRKDADWPRWKAVMLIVEHNFCIRIRIVVREESSTARWRSEDMGLKYGWYI